MIAVKHQMNNMSAISQREQDKFDDMIMMYALY